MSGKVFKKTLSTGFEFELFEFMSRALQIFQYDLGSVITVANEIAEDYVVMCLSISLSVCPQ